MEHDAKIEKTKNDSQIRENAGTERRKIRPRWGKHRKRKILGRILLL